MNLLLMQGSRRRCGFTRPSPAYLSNGTLVPAGQPRYENSPMAGFGKMVTVEEGTENKYDAASSRGESGTGYLGSSLTFVVGQTDPFGGTGAVRWQVSGGTGALKAYMSAYNPANGVKVSSQIWVKNLSATIVTVGSNLGGLTAAVVSGDGWKKVEWWAVLGNGVSTAQHLFYAPAAGDSLDFLIYHPQWEELPYCTSWQIGGTPRSPEPLTFPLAGVLTPTAGSVSAYVNVNALARRQVAGQYPTVLYIPRADGWVGIVLYHEAAAPNWVLNTHNDADVATSQSCTDSLTPDGMHLFKVVWNAASAILYIDGVARITIPTPNLPSAFGPTAYWGSWPGLDYWLNTQIDDPRASSIKRTATESAALYASGAPAPVDAWTTLKLTFDGTLAAGGGGYRDLPPVDMSDLGVVADSIINWTATVPAGTTVSTKVSLDAGATWQTATSGRTIPGAGPGDNVSGRTLLVRQVLTSDDLTVTPTLSSDSLRLISRSEFGGWAEWPLGVFVLSTPPRKADATGSVTREVEAYDLTQVLVDDKVTGRYTVAAGANYITAVQTILTGAGLTAQNLTATAKTLPVDREWDPATPKLTIINDLLAAINYRPLWFDESGVAVAQPYVSPADRASEYTYRDDDQSIIFPEVSESLDLFGVPNQIVLVVSEADRDYLKSTYTNSNPASPTSTISRGRTIVSWDRVDAPDQATLDAICQRRAFEASQVYQEVEFESGLAPYHSDLDVLTLVYGDLSISSKYEEVGWKTDLEAGAPMSHTVRRVITI